MLNGSAVNSFQSGNNINLEYQLKLQFNHMREWKEEKVGACEDSSGSKRSTSVLFVFVDLLLS
jgi:hypothetical protein